MPSDTETYHEDSFNNMKAFAAKHDFTFPYVIDETQETARAYDAQCIPTSSASTRRMNCNIAGGSMPRAYSRRQMLVASYSTR